MQHLTLFTPFRNTSFAAVFLEFRWKTSTGPPTSAMESQVFFTHLNEIHFDVTFERITSAQGGIEEVSSLLCHWSEHKHSLPLVTDAENDPELLSWLNPPPPACLTHFTYPSSVLLSVSQVGLLSHSPPIVPFCLLPPIHHPNGVSCRFKARSDSLLWTLQSVAVMVTSAAMFNTCRWWVWYLPFSRLCKVDLWRWILKSCRMFKRFTVAIRLSAIHRVDVNTFMYAWPAVVCRQNHAALSFLCTK